MKIVFFTSPISDAFHQLTSRYKLYRANLTPRIPAIVGCFWWIIAQLIFPLENIYWHPICRQQKRYYPHINPQRPRLLDIVRYIIQTLWLIATTNAPKKKFSSRLAKHLIAMHYRILAVFDRTLSRLCKNVTKDTASSENDGATPGTSRLLQKIYAGIIFITGFIMALICITQPFNPLAQFVFWILLWGVALLVQRLPGRFPSMMLIVLSLVVSCRYMWWRYTSTLNWDDPLSLFCGITLLFAETYAWIVLILGYFQVIWPLDRQPNPMPEDTNQWPSVDIFVPTYNEELSVVKNTIYASLGIDWPKDKLNIWILDDGGRESFKTFAAETGVNYIARTTHEHAKAGNINNALKYAKGDFVAIFDCDHIPARSFLQLTMGGFLKEKQLALVQTPHHFFSPDPFERNLAQFRKTPNEGVLFYGLVQNGNDMWNATFFCGSCAVIRRGPLDEIGGIATETVTEDAHTSLRLHREGYTSAYMRIPQAAGLATESISAHIGQRIRWARGMIQIFRMDNPLFGKGLSLMQRLCYTNAMLHFFSGLPRLIFLVAPLAFLLLHAYIIYAPAIMIVLFVLPHMIHASITNSRIQGDYRHSFWSEIYETVLAWYIAKPTLVALFNPHKGKFNVTAKGGLIEKVYIDWLITRPYMVLVLLNLTGIIFGLWRLYYGPQDEIATVLISMLWVIYNLIILGGAIAVSIESKQIRRSHRVEINMKAIVKLSDGHLYPCTLSDYASGGVGITLPIEGCLQASDEIVLLLRRGTKEYAFPARVARVNKQQVGLQLGEMTSRQNINFIQCTFARADTWALWQKHYPKDKPLKSLIYIGKLGWRGYRQLAGFSPDKIKAAGHMVARFTEWIFSFFPRIIPAVSQKTI